MLDFYVGQKVVCVDADCLGCERGLLAKGHVYTIRKIEAPQGRVHSRRQHYRRCVALYLHEAIRDPDDMGFASGRFRPLVQTDISVFEAMLSPKPVKQRETEDA